MDESGLLHAVRNMDADALAMVFDLYAPAIYKYSLRHSRNPFLADQIVGDVFEKLLERLAQGNGPVSNLRSYLFEMAYHLLVDEIRLTHKLAAYSELILPVSKPAEIAVEEQTLMDTVMRAMGEGLTADQRHVMILRFLEGFTLKETAMIMGKKVGNIKVIQNRAVAALRKALEDQPLEYKFIVQDAYTHQTL